MKIIVYEIPRDKKLFEWTDYSFVPDKGDEIMFNSDEYEVTLKSFVPDEKKLYLYVTKK